MAGAGGPMAGAFASGVTKRHASSDHGPCADYAAAHEGRHLRSFINENENEIFAKFSKTSKGKFRNFQTHSIETHNISTKQTAESIEKK